MVEEIKHSLPGISQFWFMIAGVITVTLAFSRSPLKQHAWAMIKFCTSQLPEIILVSSRSAPVGNLLNDISLNSLKLLCVRLCLGWEPLFAHSGTKERNNCVHIWLMTSGGWTERVELMIICLSPQEPGEIWAACLLSGARWAHLIIIRGKCLVIS